MLKLVILSALILIASPANARPLAAGPNWVPPAPPPLTLAERRAALDVRVSLLDDSWRNMPNDTPEEKWERRRVYVQWSRDKTEILKPIRVEERAVRRAAEEARRQKRKSVANTRPRATMNHRRNNARIIGAQQAAFRARLRSVGGFVP